MEYKLDGKKISIPGKGMIRIGKGLTGDVYKYKNKALKIFHDEENPPMDMDTAKFFTGIHTERIFLPEELLVGCKPSKEILRGYTFARVPKIGLSRRIINLPKEELEEVIYPVEEDVRELSKRQVLLNGIEPGNCIFNGDLYISDPALYRKLNTSSIKELEAVNMLQVHMLLSSLILSEVRKLNLGPSVEKRLKELLESREDDETISEFLYGLICPSETIKQFVKTF